MSIASHEIQLPTIHLNGTGRKALAKDYDEAAEKLQDFLTAWRKIEFHSRDYYVDGTEAWPRALEQRQQIHGDIIGVEEYLDAHRAHLHD